jgi:hypothetical protein
VYQNAAEVISVDLRKHTEARVEESQRLHEHRLKDRGKIVARGIGDLQDLGGRGLSFAAAFALQRVAFGCAFVEFAMKSSDGSPKINDLDELGAALTPEAADAPPVIDPDAVLTATVALHARAAAW